MQYRNKISRVHKKILIYIIIKQKITYTILGQNNKFDIIKNKIQFCRAPSRKYKLTLSRREWSLSIFPVVVSSRPILARLVG